MVVRVSRRAGTAPTLSDVAKAAGVSPMTVSRVINSEASVREITKQRVKAAIATLGYSPNAAARVLAGAARTRLALLYGNPSSAYLSEVLVGGLAEASLEDAQLIMEQCNDLASAKAVSRVLIEKQIDGVMLPPPFCDDPALLTIFRQAQIPAAMLATGEPADDMFAVTIDDAQAAKSMTNHLIALGHRRIGFITGNPNQTTSMRRLAGFRVAMAEAGLECPDTLIAEGDFSFRSGLAAADRLISASTRPTAIFASNDDMAAAVVAMTHRHHLDVPKDLSVVGFDDTALATTISPELTTVRQPVAQMAKMAVEMLMNAARQRRSGRPYKTEHRLLAYEIVIRESDAMPRLT